MKDLKKNSLVRASAAFPSTFLVKEDILRSYHVEYYYKRLFLWNSWVFKHVAMRMSISEF